MTKRTVSVILVSMFLLLVVFEIRRMTPTAVAAESAVGVKVGDWVKYKVMATFASDDLNVEIPADLIEMNNTEWIKNMVVNVSDTIIRFDRTVRYKDGNETTSREHVFVDTGECSTYGSLMFIQSNLGKDDPVHASPNEHYSINETIQWRYLGATRDVNHLNVSTIIYGESDVTVITANYYWDKTTGILCERPGTLVAYDGTYTTSFATSEMIVDTNLWVGEPDTQSPVAEAGQDQTVVENTIVNFNASGSSDNVGIASYLWDFGDGTTRLGITATYVYTKIGSYVVTLTVRDAAGNSDTDTMTVNVEEATTSPIVGISVLVAVVLVVVGLFIWRRKKPRRRR